MFQRAQYKGEGHWFLMALIGAVIWSASGGTGHGQVVSARLSGTVIDVSGATVPAANVTATNTSTGVATAAVSSDAGEYDFLSLAPGTYNLVANKQGFKAAALSGVELVVNQRARLDIRLEVGDLKTTVEVAGAAPMIETTTANIGSVIGALPIVKLPLNLRRYGALAVLVPGTTPDNGGTAGSFQGSLFSDTSYNANGARSSSNNYLVDGANAKNFGQGGFALQPPPDAVQEFKIQTGAYSAVFGMSSGSTINLVTKSGTNQIHGSVYEFLRNNSLDARNYFSASKSKLTRNQFGGTLGGPIRKNKTFGFFNYEGLRSSRAIPNNSSIVPTDTLKSGDFSSYLQPGTPFNLCGAGGPANLDFATGQLFDAGTLSQMVCPAGSAKAGNTILVGTPIAGNIITNIDPVAQIVLKGYPEPNQAGVRNYLNSTPETRTENQYLGRLDHALGASDQLSGRYMLGSVLWSRQRSNPEFGEKSIYRAQNLALTWTHTFGPNLINEARFGFQRTWAWRGGSKVPRAQGFMAAFGIDNFKAVGPQFEAHPAFGISGFAGVGDGGYRPATWPDMMEKYQDNLTWVHGKHTITAGADMLFDQELSLYLPVSLNGGISYNGQYSGLAGQVPGVSDIRGLADLMMGYPSGGYRTQRFATNNWVGGAMWNYYIQDDIKVNSRLSLNLGLRYEFRRPLVDKRDNLVSLFPTAAPFSGPGNAKLLTAAPDAQNDAYCTDPFYSYLLNSDGSCSVASSSERAQFGFTGRKRRSLVETYKNNWAPRIGMALRPTDSNRVVIRAGYGIFYDMLPFENLLFVHNNPISNPTQVYSTTFGAPPPGKVQQVFAGSGGIAPIVDQFLYAYVDHEWKTPYLHMWSFGISSQVAENWAFDVDYVGNKQKDYSVMRLFGNQPKPGVGALQPRRPYPDFNQLLLVYTGGFGRYDSLQAKLTKKTSNGLTFLGSYTFQKGLNNQDGNEGYSGGGSQFNPQDDNNPNADYGRSYSDQTHRLVMSYVYELPFGKGKRFLNQAGAVNQVLGGWQVSGITAFTTGFPVTVFSAVDWSNTGTLSPRPDRTCNGKGARTLDAWFDTSCFTTTDLEADFSAGTPRYGNSGRSIFNAPGAVTWDFALLKDFNITERFNLEFRAEAYNFPNHMNPGFPNATIGDSRAGRILGGSAARVLQFGLKLGF